MNLTASQQQILKDYLSNELTYRETYNELYDHISSGLENIPEGSSFEETVKSYVRKEFGGIFGLHAIEKQYRSTVLRGMKKQYLDNISQPFRFPWVILLSIAALVVYNIFSASWFNTAWYFGLFIIAGLAVSAINTIRYIRMGYLRRSIRRSVKDEGFTRLKYAPVALISVFALYYYFFIGDTHGYWHNNVSPVVMTVVFIAYALHVVSFYKMYRADFKVNVAA